MSDVRHEWLNVYRCDSCGDVGSRPPYLTDETSTVELCSPECVERQVDEALR